MHDIDLLVVASYSQVCQSVLRDTEVIKVAARASSDVQHIGSKDAILVVIANVDQAGFEEACILKRASNDFLVENTHC